MGYNWQDGIGPKDQRPARGSTRLRWSNFLDWGSRGREFKSLRPDNRFLISLLFIKILSMKLEFSARGGLALLL